MTTIARKRLRSDESPCSAIQTKIRINQRIVDQNDNNKMQEIHAKTVRQLFDAARQPKQDATTPSLALWQQLALHGDGRISSVQFCKIPLDLAVNRRRAKCCAGRESFVQNNCTNCSFDLCESCGYSCSDCGRFLCGACVTLFGCGTIEHPICEKCTIFN